MNERKIHRNKEGKEEDGGKMKEKRRKKEK